MGGSMGLQVPGGRSGDIVLELVGNLSSKLHSPTDAESVVGESSRALRVVADVVMK